MPQGSQEFIEILKIPLELLKRVGVDVDLQTSASRIANQLSTDTSGVFPWLQELWAKTQGMISGGNILGGLWELMKELLDVAVGLLEALADLLRSLIGSF